MDASLPTQGDISSDAVICQTWPSARRIRYPFSSFDCGLVFSSRHRNYIYLMRLPRVRIFLVSPYHPYRTSISLQVQYRPGNSRYPRSLLRISLSPLEFDQAGRGQGWVSHMVRTWLSPLWTVRYLFGIPAFSWLCPVNALLFWPLWPFPFIGSFALLPWRYGFVVIRASGKKPRFNASSQYQNGDQIFLLR